MSENLYDERERRRKLGKDTSKVDAAIAAKEEADDAATPTSTLIVRLMPAAYYSPSQETFDRICAEIDRRVPPRTK